MSELDSWQIGALNVKVKRAKLVPKLGTKQECEPKVSTKSADGHTSSGHSSSGHSSSGHSSSGHTSSGQTSSGLPFGIRAILSDDNSSRSTLLENVNKKPVEENKQTTPFQSSLVFLPSLPFGLPSESRLPGVEPETGSLPSSSLSPFLLTNLINAFSYGLQQQIQHQYQQASLIYPPHQTGPEINSGPDIIDDLFPWMEKKDQISGMIIVSSFTICTYQRYHIRFS